jgi:hypothetical protein
LPPPLLRLKCFFVCQTKEEFLLRSTFFSDSFVRDRKAFRSRNPFCSLLSRKLKNFDSSSFSRVVFFVWHKYQSESERRIQVGKPAMSRQVKWFFRANFLLRSLLADLLLEWQREKISNLSVHFMHAHTAREPSLEPKPRSGSGGEKCFIGFEIAVTGSRDKWRQL